MSYGANNPNGLPLGLPSIVSLGLAPGVNPYPALDLDFINNQTLDSRITFTRASSATFFDQLGVLQTAASGAARFTYNPATLQPQGLLIEEQRANFWLFSEDITNASGWLSANATRTAATNISPAGTLTANTWTVTANGASTLVSNGGTITAGATVTHSIYIKKSANTDWVFLGLRAPDFNHEAGIFININTGAIGNSAVLAGTQVSYVANSATATPVGNGWYRISASFATTVATSAVGCLRAARSNGSINDPVANDSYFVWARQGEVGAFPTSYIPTTTTALTRNADVASMTGTNFSSWFNAAEGTLYAEYARIGASNFQAISAISDNTTSNVIALAFGSGAPTNNQRFDINASGSSQASITVLTNPAINTNFKTAGAYKANDFAATASGAAPGTDTTGTIPTVDRLRIGANGDGSGGFLSGTIRRIAYYPVRVSDAQLQALTQ